MYLRSTLLRELVLGAELGYTEAASNLAWLLQAATEQQYYNKMSKSVFIGDWLRNWMSNQHRFAVLGEGALGLVEAARSQLLLNMLRTQPARGKMHPLASLRNQESDSVIHHLNNIAAQLYEQAADRSAFAALRAGDSAFYGGLGWGSFTGGSHPNFLERNLTQAAVHYRHSAALELEAIRIAEAPRNRGELGSATDGAEEVPTTALLPGRDAERARGSWHGGPSTSWQGAYSAAYMIEYGTAEGRAPTVTQLGLAMRAYLDVLRPPRVITLQSVVAVAWALHRCVSKLILSMFLVVLDD